MLSHEAVSPTRHGSPASLHKALSESPTAGAEGQLYTHHKLPSKVTACASNAYKRHQFKRMQREKLSQRKEVMSRGSRHRPRQSSGGEQGTPDESSYQAYLIHQPSAAFFNSPSPPMTPQFDQYVRKVQVVVA
jgi:hypothetical protein